jgi:hypothetical protein
VNFDGEWAIKGYNIDWVVSPKMPYVTYRNDEYFTFKPSELMEDTNYMIIVSLSLKDYPDVNDTLNYQF